MKKFGWSSLEAETLLDTFEDFWRVETSLKLKDVAENPSCARSLRFALFVTIQLYELYRPRRSSQLSDYDVKASSAVDHQGKEEAEEARHSSLMVGRQNENAHRLSFVQRHLGEFISTMLLLVPDKVNVSQSVVDALGFLLGAADSTGRRVGQLSQVVEFGMPSKEFVSLLASRLIESRGHAGWDAPLTSSPKG